MIDLLTHRDSDGIVIRMTTQLAAHTKQPTFASLVSAELRRQERSGRWLARKLNSNQAFIQRRLSGEVEFEASLIAKISDILNVPVSRFFPEERAS